MVGVIHPASSDILLLVYRDGPRNESEWVTVRRGAVTLAESGNLLMMWGRGVPSRTDQGEWMEDAKMLPDVGTAAYKAAQVKDGSNWLARQNGSTRPAPPVTGSTGRMCFRVKEDRNKLFAREFPEGRRVGRGPDRDGRGRRLYRQRSPI